MLVLAVWPLQSRYRPTCYGSAKPLSITVHKPLGEESVLKPLAAA